MLFAAILPAISAIMVSFTRFAGAGISIMPCSAARSTSTFKISDFTGGISRYTGGESFAFYLNTTFNDYHSGCSGSISKGADDGGVQWCATRIPGFNTSYIMTHDHKILITQAYQCSLPDGTIVDAHAEGATSLTINTGTNGRLGMEPSSTDFPAATKTLL